MNRRLPLLNWFASSLAYRLVGTVALVLGVLSLVFLVVVVDFYRGRIGAEQVRAAGQFNTLLQASLENAMLKRDLDGLRAILVDIARGPEIDSVSVLNTALEVRFTSDTGTGAVPNMSRPEIAEALARRESLTLTVDDPGGASFVRSITPVANQPECHECHGTVAERPVNGILVVDYAFDALGGDIRASAMWLAALGLVVIASTAAAVSWVVHRSVLVPVRALSRATEDFGNGNGTLTLPPGGHDEMSRLGRSFESMASHLQVTMGGLRASEARLQAVIDAIPDGIRVIDRQHRIVRANAAYARRAGLPLERVLGQTCHASSHGSATPCAETMVLCPLVEIRSPGETLTCRQIHIDRDGQEHHVEVAAAWVDLGTADSPAPGIVESIRDLDQQAQLGQEHRLAELGLLAAGLAHEIFNPLSSINMLVSAIAQDVESAGDRRLDGHLQTLRDEIARTLALTGSLLTLCQPSGENLLLSLAEVVPSALAILEFEAQKTGAQMHLDVPADLRVMASESDLRMSLTNLVQNALHAMPEGGTVSVTVRRVGNRVRITVADTGHGIPAADLRRVLLPFWTRRADGTMGRGLGLTLVLSAMERAQGRLDVESTPGVGSCFTLDFPDPDATEGPQG